MRLLDFDQARVAARPSIRAPAWERDARESPGVSAHAPPPNPHMCTAQVVFKENAPLQAQPTVSAAHCRLCVLAPRCCCCSAHRVAARRCGPHLAPELVVPGSRGHLVREASRIALAVRRVQRRPTIRSSSTGSCIHALQRCCSRGARTASQSGSTSPCMTPARSPPPCRSRNRRTLALTPHSCGAHRRASPAPSYATQRNAIILTKL